MGAEGTIVIMPRKQWDEHTTLDPSEFGFYSGVILGKEAVWSYYGEPEYELPGEYYAEGEEKEMFDWFRGNGEHHEVWT